MIRRCESIAATLIVGIGLAGCTHLQPGSDELSYGERRDYLMGLEAWALRGRIAVDTGERAFQGRFQWSQEADALALTVRGPLGTNVLRVSGPAKALVVESRGETFNLDEPEAQLSALVGWWLPVMSFKRWLLGLPDPDYAAQTRFGDDNLLAELDQRLWQLSFVSHQLAAGVLVPRRIDLSHESLEFRIVVDSFDPAP
ncbi:MAG: outer membrane lipoprotein LolB [Gammaproteobacteria bacterium]|nr:outer membrane lipoprotein LolB [Gammaproteobacteria bacterium]